MVIFNSYVKLSEGKPHNKWFHAKNGPGLGQEFDD